MIQFQIAATVALLFVGFAGRAAAEPPPAQASADAIAALKTYLATPGAHAALGDQTFASIALTREDAKAAAALLWDDHAKRLREDRAAELKARVLTDGKLEMPFWYKVFGDKPKTGRSLFISMHGGGNAAKAVNDSQYENQKRLYQPAEGVYLAPRAPTNTWNLWHEAHIDRLYDRLIQDLIVLEDVDPNRVYIMGYSAGGDGVYQLAPRMADRLAAASMMAGHPNDASPLGLRNLPFAIHVGALDGGYNRNKVAAEWGVKLDALQKANPAGYVHVAKLHAGKSHWMDREDAEAVPWMAQYTRDPAPKHVVWKQSSVVHSRFYWLAVPADRAKAGAEVYADIEGQTITVKVKDVDRLMIRLDDRLVDPDKAVVVRIGDREIYNQVAPRTLRILAATVTEYGDPFSMFTSEIDVKIDAGK